MRRSLRRGSPTGRGSIVGDYHLAAREGGGPRCGEAGADPHHVLDAHLGVRATCPACLALVAPPSRPGEPTYDPALDCVLADLLASVDALCDGRLPMVDLRRRVRALVLKLDGAARGSALPSAWRPR